MEALKARLTTFPEPIGGYENPFDRYRRTRIPQNRRHEIYVSMPLTGGKARKYVEQTGEFPTEEDIFRATIDANLRAIDIVTPHLLTQFPDSRITLPHMLGAKQDGWRQVDYNTYWMMYLMGVPQAEVYYLVSKMPTLSRLLVGATEIPASRRQQSYRVIRAEFSRAVRRNEIPLNPVGRVLHLPGYQESHGATHEGELARRGKVMRHAVLFNKNHPDYIEHIEPQCPWYSEEEQIQNAQREGMFNLVEL